MTKMTEIGPIYNVPLIDTLPLGTRGMLQACPTRADLKQVAVVNERTAAAYEVLLGHYQRLQEEIERLEQAIREAIELSNTGSERHKTEFDPYGQGRVPVGWRVVEKMREVLVDAMGGKT